MPGCTWAKRLIGRWLGLDLMQQRVDQMEAELSVYRLYLAEAVVLPPGREILQSWRQRPMPIDVEPPPAVPEKYAHWAR